MLTSCFAASAADEVELASLASPLLGTRAAPVAKSADAEDDDDDDDDDDVADASGLTRLVALLFFSRRLPLVIVLSSALSDSSDVGPSPASPSGSAFSVVRW